MNTFQVSKFDLICLIQTYILQNKIRNFIIIFLMQYFVMITHAVFCFCCNSLHSIYCEIRKFYSFVHFFTQVLWASQVNLVTLAKTVVRLIQDPVAI